MCKGISCNQDYISIKNLVQKEKNVSGETKVQQTQEETIQIFGNLKFAYKYIFVLMSRISIWIKIIIIFAISR